MRNCAFLSVAAAACAVSASARLLHSLPEDIHAFPKYAVEFLNGLPVLNETAVRWLKHGLRGGELEFLDQPWEDHHRNARPVRKEIGSGEASPASSAVCCSCQIPSRFTFIYLPSLLVFPSQLYPGAYENGSTRFIYLSHPSAVTEWSISSAQFGCRCHTCPKLVPAPASHRNMPLRTYPRFSINSYSCPLCPTASPGLVHLFLLP